MAFGMKVKIRSRNRQHGLLSGSCGWILKGVQNVETKGRASTQESVGPSEGSAGGPVRRGVQRTQDPSQEGLSVGRLNTAVESKVMALCPPAPPQRA